MTYEEFRRQLGKAGITVKEFAHLVKAHPVSIASFKKQPHVPKNMALIAALMGDMAENGIDFHETISKIDIEPHAPNPKAFGGKKK